MRNCSVILALLFGYLIAACIKFEGKKYVITNKIEQAPGITFLWTKTFPLGFYPPALIPLAIVFCITSIETVGDTTATLEASHMDTVGDEFTRRVKGGWGAGRCRVLGWMDVWVNCDGCSCVLHASLAALHWMTTRRGPAAHKDTSIP